MLLIVSEKIPPTYCVENEIWGGRERSLFEATPKDNIVNNSSCCPWNREGKNQLDLPGRMWSSRGPLSICGKKRVAFLCFNISNVGFDI